VSSLEKEAVAIAWSMFEYVPHVVLNRLWLCNVALPFYFYITRVLERQVILLACVEALRSKATESDL
jgi:hypothetical protein